MLLAKEASRVLSCPCSQEVNKHASDGIIYAVAFAGDGQFGDDQDTSSLLAEEMGKEGRALQSVEAVVGGSIGHGKPLLSPT